MNKTMKIETLTHPITEKLYQRHLEDLIEVLYKYGCQPHSKTSPLSK